MNRTFSEIDVNVSGDMQRSSQHRAFRRWMIGACVVGFGALTANAPVDSAPPTTGSPIVTSPITPWYHSAVGQHHGGLFNWTDNAAAALVAVDSTNQLTANASASAVYPTPWAEGLGIDTNIYPPFNSATTVTGTTAAGATAKSYATEIPNYGLGNYRGFNDYTNAQINMPSGATLKDAETDNDASATDKTSELVNFAPDSHGGALYNNFRDTGFYSWSAPFTWTINNGQAPTSETVDDQGLVAVPGSLTTAQLDTTRPAGTTPANNPTWTGNAALAWPVTSGPVTVSAPVKAWGTYTIPATNVPPPDDAGSATNNEYATVGVELPGNIQNPTNPASGDNLAQFAWTFTVRHTGFYSLFVNIPLIPVDSNGLATQVRIRDAHYSARVTNSVGAVILSGDTRISQQESNSPAPTYVLGPYYVVAGNTLKLFLDNSGTQGDPDNGIVVADSATLRSVSGHDVKAGAAVISKQDYPEIQNASYYGILAGSPGTVNGNPYTAAMADRIPYGKYTTDTTGTAAVASTSAAVPPQHEIRQLAYFGDSELVIAVKHNPDGTTSNYQHTVGCVYCVDGLRGNVVWRYQCPDSRVDPNDIRNDELTNNGVMMTPTVARINVLDPNPIHIDGLGNRKILPNKLVVIFGDQNGKVYCLDAIGNGILPASTISSGTGTNVFDSTTIPNQEFTTDPTAATNYSLPLDFDNVANPGVLLNQWSAASPPAQVPCTSPKGEATETPSSGPCVNLNPASLTPVAAPYTDPTNGNVNVCLFAGTTVYWVFRPNGLQGANYIQDDATSPTATNGISFNPPPAADIVNGFDTDAANSPLDWTTVTPAVAVGGEYQKVAAVNKAITVPPGKLATFKWTMNLSTPGIAPVPQVGTYTVNVTIPPIAASSVETRTSAHYVVQYNKITYFDGYVSQVNGTGNYLTVALASIPISNLLLPVTVQLDNTSQSPASNPDPTSAQTGETIVADAASLSITFNAESDTTSMMPLPGAFNQAAPAIYVEPAVQTAGATLPGMTINTEASKFGPTSTEEFAKILAGIGMDFADPQPVPPPDLPKTDGTNTVGTAYLYVVNSNGTMYSLDPAGALVTKANIYQSLNIDPNQGNIQSDSWTPTANVRWWYDVRQDQWTKNLTEINSAPSILVPDPLNQPQIHEVFFGTAKETTTTNLSMGRVYALDSRGPVDLGGNFLATLDGTGRALPLREPIYKYNVIARPFWAFPDAFGPLGDNGTGSPTATSSSKAGAPPLGDITGTPVPFYNPDTNETRVYVAANCGLELSEGANNSQITVNRLDPMTFGRIWSISVPPAVPALTLGVQTTRVSGVLPLSQNSWAYPSQWDPNDPSHFTANGSNVLQTNLSDPSTIYFPQGPIGAFSRATPAIGIVQFPNDIRFGAAQGTVWTHHDVWHEANTNDSSGEPNDIKGHAVPMLYIGCDGDPDKGFYALDLDGGDWTLGGTSTVAATDSNAAATDNHLDLSRKIFRMESPNGLSWASSPVLVVNQQAYHNHTWNGSAYTVESDPLTGTHDATWGNGGAIFATAGNNLYQIAATPVTNLNVSQPGPLVHLDVTIPGFGALCGPTLAAPNIAGLENAKSSADATGTSAKDQNSPITDLTQPNVVYADPNQVSDWVYCGDQYNGVFRAITPQKQAFGAGSEIGAEIPTDVTPPPVAINARLPLHAYIGIEAKDSSDMTPAPAPHGGAGGMLAMDQSDATSFVDWGSSIYVRISNVVPPNPNDSDPTKRMVDRTGQLSYPDQGYYLTNGSPVSYTITEVPATQVTSGSTFTDYQASGSVAILNDLPGDGFIIRSNKTGGYLGDNDETQSSWLQDNINSYPALDNNAWIYASTYFIGNGTGHSDTPGATRRIINATQTCQVYKGDINSPTPGTPTSNTVTLSTELTQGQQYQTTDPTTGLATGLAQTIPTPDPTFGIANPLGMAGAGLLANQTKDLGAVGYELGYKSGVPNYPNKTANPNPLAQDGYESNNGLDMQANGNFVYRGLSDIPKAGLTINYDPTGANNGTASNSFSPNGTIADVATNAGYIHDGKAGDNSMPANSTSGAENTARNNYWNMGLGIGDRSQVGLRGMSIKVNLKDVPAAWYDNSTLHGTGAWVNPLPWEDAPVSFDYGANNSYDYPDIGTNNLSAYLQTQGSVKGSGPRQGRDGEMVSGSVTLDPRDITQGGSPTNPNDNNTYNDKIRTTFSVPKYQPANLTTDAIGMPVGYTATQRAFVDTNNNGQWDEGETYRDFEIKAGVPINAATHMGDNTIDVGTESAGFGVQMDPFLQALDPIITADNGTTGTTPLNPPYLFTPYTGYYRNSFQPLAVYNDGNVNLLNIHLDQKQRNGNLPAPWHPLVLGSSAVDSGNPVPGTNTVDINAGIPAVDVLGQTRPNTNTLPGSLTSVDNTSGSGTPAQSFLIRSSLDTDLVQAYGRNPRLFTNRNINNVPWSDTYQGLTFHKARPGSTSPSQLRVPDTSPYISNPNDPWWFPQSNDPPSLVTTGSNLLPAASYIPYVGVSVPLGTPVGTYSDQISVFDGTDTDFFAFGKPTYNGGYPASLPTVYGTIDELLYPLYDAAGQRQTAGQLTSNPTANLKVTVVEHRMTDAPPDYLNPSNAASNASAPNGNVFGVLRDILDPASATVKALPDFYPAAVRDLWWSGGTAHGTGSIAMLWSSARNATENNDSYPNLSLASALLGTNAANDTLGWFKAATPADVTKPEDYSWWQTIGDVYNGQATNAMKFGFSAGESIAQDMPIYNPSNDTFASDGSSFAFWVNTDLQEKSASNPTPSNTGLSTIYCAPYSAATGVMGTIQQVTPFPTTPSGSASANVQPITAALEGATDVRGLKYQVTQNGGGATTFAIDPANGQFNTQDPNSGHLITNNIWAFWTVGGHGQSSIYYESGASSGSNLAFSQAPLALPIPAGLSGVSDASATVIPAPDTTAAPSGTVGVNPPATVVGSTLSPPTVPVLEVTYAGIDEAGNSNIYVSRFRPYLPNGTTLSNGVQNVGLWPVPYMLTNELLQPDSGGVWWKGRDIGWVRNTNVNVCVNGASLFGGSTKASFDKASGLMVYTGLTRAGLSSVLVDLPHGRLRFSPALPARDTNGVPTYVNVFVNPMARVVSSTGAKAASEPTALVDQAFANNEAISSSTNVTLSRAQAARYWAIYRKAGAGVADKVGAQLWANTQRLGIPLYNTTGGALTLSVTPTDPSAGAPTPTKMVTIPPGGRLAIDPLSLNSAYSGTVPQVQVKDITANQVLYPASSGPSADIDWAHGVIYLPLLINEGTVGSGANWVSPEGHLIEVKFAPRGFPANGPITVTEDDYVHWIDEARFNDSSNGGAAVINEPGAINGQTYVSAIAGAAANDFVITTGKNESQPFAFIDPLTYADVLAGAADPFTRAQNAVPAQAVTDQPHKLWLFWSSTRDASKLAGPGASGAPIAASDLYYEALAPAFGATP